MMMQTIRVLLVEDEALLRRALFNTLQTFESLTVCAAASLREAESQLEFEPVDVILTDLNLADGAGTELANAPRRSEMGFVLMTGQPLVSSERQEYIGLGFLILAKPFGPKDCYSAILEANKMSRAAP